MNIKKVLENIEYLPSREEMTCLKLETKKFFNILANEIKKEKIKADVFIGGSFAKGTVSKSENYDIDIFLRFEKDEGDISKKLEKILKKISEKTGIKYLKIHGSRDYFRIENSKMITFEVIPVLKIKKANDAKNVTDLSYFHVNFVRRALSEKMKREVAIAKTFFKAQEVYGAESYIGGFSGYAIECLIFEYKTFNRLIKEILKISEDKKLVIDTKKFYKNHEEVLLKMNENKINSPIVLVDPTWKERNVLAALSNETLKKLQKKILEFLNKPSEKYFCNIERNYEEIKKNAQKKNCEFIHVFLETEKQAGDIAGTKMKKFARCLAEQLKKYFEIVDFYFEYDGKKKSEVYFIVKSKKEIIRRGPIEKDIKNARKFKEKNKKVFVKKGRLYAKIFIVFGAKEFLNNYYKREKQRLKEMGITSMKVE